MPTDRTPSLRPLGGLLLALCLLLAGCAATARNTSSPAEPVSCSWQWLSGGGLRLHAQECQLATGHWRILWEEQLPGFALWRDNERIATVVQLFTKPVDAPVETILPELHRLGLIPDDDGCRPVPTATRPLPRTMAAYIISPVGPRLAAFEATPAGQIPDPPCGEYGWSTHGVRYFLTDLRRPGLVLYFNEGQDGMFFDPTSLLAE